MSSSQLSFEAKYTQQDYPACNSVQVSTISLQTLQKIYQKEDKGSGAEDVIEKKLRIFYALYHKANVNPSDYPKAFAAMITGGARDYYFNKMSENRLDLKEMVELIKGYFETEQCQERKTVEWEDTKLEDYKLKNLDKTLLECFYIMRDQLLKDQAILRPEFHYLLRTPRISFIHSVGNYD